MARRYASATQHAQRCSNRSVLSFPGRAVDFSRRTRRGCGGTMPSTCADCLADAAAPVPAVSVSRAGMGTKPKRGVVATADDLRTANRWPAKCSPPRADSAPAQTRQLLVRARPVCQQRSRPRAWRVANVRFISGQVREAWAGVPERCGVSFGRLVEWEYVLVYRAVAATNAVYQLLKRGPRRRRRALLLAWPMWTLADGKRLGSQRSGASGSAPPPSYEPAVCASKPAACAFEPATHAAAIPAAMRRPAKTRSNRVVQTLAWRTGTFSQKTVKQERAPETRHTLGAEASG